MVPNGWTAKTLNELCKMQAGKFVKAADIHSEFTPNLYPCFGGNGLRGFTKSFTHEGEYSLIGRQGALCGNITLAKGKFHATEHAVVTFPKKGIDTKWLYYILNDLNLNQYATGQAQPGLSVKNLESVLTVAPDSLPEQRKIAQILSTWDRSIATTEKLIDASKQQKKALMQQLLTGKKRLIDPETGKAFEGEWEEVKVGEFGKVVTGNTPPKNNDSNYGSDISWATAEDFKSKYVGNTKVKLTKLGASKARIVPKGSVLVTCIASIGKNAIAYENITTNQQINAVVINNNHCNEFFYYQIEFNKHKLLAWAGTTAVPILNKSSFEKIPLSAPLKNEQQRIASVLTAADKEIELLEAKLAHLKQEKKALMQQLLTGKRRVSLSS
ncbi:restriction endonuclease subunit S [Vibrio owensii]|uniref:restriction endonuclease subunit S n=1 Tax=Vibrio owensii TaxID=696485 RepID=UPI003DA1740B